MSSDEDAGETSGQGLFAELGQEIIWATSWEEKVSRRASRVILSGRVGDKSRAIIKVFVKVVVVVVVVVLRSWNYG
jgi:hypothetical protein